MALTAEDIDFLNRLTREMVLVERRRESDRQRREQVVRATRGKRGKRGR